MIPCQAQYLYQVRWWMVHCPDYIKERLLKGLSQEIDEFIIQMPDSTYEDLIELFGQPEEVARQLLDAMTMSEWVATQKYKRYGAVIIIAILITIIAQMSIVLWRELTAPKDRVREIIYVSQPYFGPDGAIEHGGGNWR